MGEVVQDEYHGEIIILRQCVSKCSSIEMYTEEEEIVDQITLYAIQSLREYPFVNPEISTNH